ncbi:hypothetical protein LTR22_002386 [Elasticomyces elasticus]|nr:hypothetical protein LTR22_002386 [Elasticomyces elasticus]KAK4918823.1 hypothetical protein LTR49_013454 [Elasticomyces elasticus]KAK5758740.1 hypothetical protein LTS12_011134 [Elasticomyces elasticus]
MLVRQSPRARISPDKNPAQWPPKSPFQALLSSPSGRKKWQDHHSNNRERSVSPSPVKRSSRALQESMRDEDEDDGKGEEEEDDLSDEEARAALELARIEAKLKLDGIRRKKRLVNAEGGGGGSVRSSSPRKTARSAIEVPVSPTKPLLQQTEHVSPARKRLGLHVPAKAVEVSLKRARDGTTATTSVREEAPRGKSFNERLRDTVHQAGEREARAERVEKGRSRGFGSAFVQSMERVEKAGESTRSTKETSLSRAGSTRSSNRKITDATAENETARPRRTEAATTTTTRPASSKPVAGSTRSTYTSEDIRARTDKSFRRPTLPPPPNTDTTTPPPPDPEPTPSSSYDSYSELHLSKRHIPHATIARALEGKEIYPLPRLLKEVKSPSYDPPDIDTDYVVFAVLASKSSPYDQKSKNRTSDEGDAQDDANAPRNKFMVLKLTDLNWEIDCFLFGTAFDQFWKLVPGTLLAILNPDILPPKGSARERDSGRFSLKLGSSEDSVMEVGVARDLKWCSSVKKDGRKCEEWVDGRGSEICEFHLNLLVERQRKGRMEVNTMWRGRAGNGGGVKSLGREEGGWNKQMNKQKGVTQSREYGTLWAVKSTANLLDAEDTDRLSEWNEGEKSRVRLAAKEKERDLQRQLEKLSSNDESVGAEYMRAKSAAHPSGISKARDVAAQERERLFEKPRASELGLLGNKAEGARMSPAKDRKRHFGVGAGNTNAGGKDAMGWGGYAKWGLLDKQSKKGDGKGEMEKGQTKLNVPGPATTRPSAVRARSQDGSVSPSKKRARFMLAEKGLRTPGRESGGVEVNDGNGYDEDDDDDLDIVQ